MHRFLGFAVPILAAVALAGCAPAAPEQAAALPTASPVPPTAPPTLTAPPPTVAPIDLPEGAALTPPAVTPPAPPPTAAALPTTADGLPYGRTPEGYPFLGSPDAPVTLTMYSDFL